MGNLKQIKIKNRKYYFFNDMINIKNFDSSLLKIDKKSYKNVDIYHIGYITIKSISKYNSINSVKPLYFTIGEVDGCIEEKKMKINTYILLLQIKTKKYYQNIQNFGIKLNI